MAERLDSENEKCSQALHVTTEQDEQHETSETWRRSGVGRGLAGVLLLDPLLHLLQLCHVPVVLHLQVLHMSHHELHRSTHSSLLSGTGKPKYHIKPSPVLRPFLWPPTHRGPRAVQHLVHSAEQLRCVGDPLHGPTQDVQRPLHPLQDRLPASGQLQPDVVLRQVAGVLLRLQPLRQGVLVTARGQGDVGEGRLGATPLPSSLSSLSGAVAGLELRHEEVDGEMDVVHELLLRHLHMSYGNSQTQHLQHKVLIVSQQGGELASLVQPRAEDTRDLLDQRLRGQEGILLESLDVHVWQLSNFGFVTMLLVSKDAHGKLGPGESLQPADSQSEEVRSERGTLVWDSGYTVTSLQ
ncbi:hypothetical protein EYF80_006831 [Liparis tanakae]|uniref:Uncharacterized protein n=1 Tax=Liparis tanakae TaxID=230148 RepID=A0A4Z2IZ96_9TELE|nr:hypothetical protein EYF80_006831 [Liparis tanakae]